MIASVGWITPETLGLRLERQEQKPKKQLYWRVAGKGCRPLWATTKYKIFPFMMLLKKTLKHLHLATLSSGLESLRGRAIVAVSNSLFILSI